MASFARAKNKDKGGWGGRSIPPICKHNSRRKACLGLLFVGVSDRAQPLVILLDPQPPPPICKHSARMMGLDKMQVLLLASKEAERLVERRPPPPDPPPHLCKHNAAKDEQTQQCSNVSPLKCSTKLCLAPTPPEGGAARKQTHKRTPAADYRLATLCSRMTGVDRF